MEEFGLMGETCIWGFGMELQGRVSDLILDGASHYPTSFLKTQGIALRLWNQQRIICTVKGYGDPNDNNLYLGDTLRKPVSSLPHVSTSRQCSIPAPVYPGLGRAKICGSKRRQWGPSAVLCQLQSLLHSSPTPITPELQTWKRGVPPPPNHPRFHRLPSPPPLSTPSPSWFCATKAKGKKKKKDQGERKGEKGREPRWPAVGSQEERCGWSCGGDFRGYN